MCAVSVFWTLVVHLPSLRLLALIPCPIYHLFSLIFVFGVALLIFTPCQKIPSYPCDRCFLEQRQRQSSQPSLPSSQSVYFLLSLRAPAQLIGLFIYQNKSFSYHYRYSKRVIRHSRSLRSHIHSHTSLHSTPPLSSVLLSITRTGQHKSASALAYICISEPSPQDLEMITPSSSFPSRHPAIAALPQPASCLLHSSC